MKRLWLCSSVLSLAFILGSAIAATVSPVAQLTQIANQMIVQLEQNKAVLKTASARLVINRIVDTVLVPHVAMDKMGSAVLGRQYWNSATSQQKQDFLQQFKLLLISTYASALASYDDDKIQFYPLRGNYQAQNTILVRSVILRKNGQRVGIDYNLVRMGSAWQVYDFSIENVSMVQSYRAQFANVLASGGMQALLERLHQHNRQNS